MSLQVIVIGSDNRVFVTRNQINKLEVSISRILTKLHTAATLESMATNLVEAYFGVHEKDISVEWLNCIQINKDVGPEEYIDIFCANIASNTIKTHMEVRALGVDELIHMFKTNSANIDKWTLKTIPMLIADKKKFKRDIEK